MQLDDIDILRIMPSSLAADKGVQMAAKAFNETFREIIKDIPSVSIIPRLLRREIVDNLLLDLLAWQFHVDFYETDMPIQTKQTLILNSLDWHTRKGTPATVEEIVTAVISDVEVKEWYEFGGKPYTFQVITAQSLVDMDAIEKLYRAVFSVKNTRSWIDTITSLITSSMKLYYGIGVFFNDIMHIRTSIKVQPQESAEQFIGVMPVLFGRINIIVDKEVNHQQPVGQYVGVWPVIFGRINILAEG